MNDPSEPEPSSLPRPPIPDPMKREIRQRCGFGCVICGQPLYHFDHMHGWDESKGHVADEITLLCGSHHDEKTRGVLPLEKVLQADRDPVNLKTGGSRPHLLHYQGGRCTVEWGGNVTVADARDHSVVPIIWIDMLPMLMVELEDGQLLLTVHLFDTFNALVLKVIRNELVHTTSTWDVEWKGGSLIFREAHRHILMELVFDPPDKLQLRRGRFLRNGVEILIGPGGASLNNAQISVIGSMTYGVAGVIVGPIGPNVPAVVRTNVPRYPRSTAFRKAWLESNFPDWDDTTDDSGNEDADGRTEEE